MSGVPRERTDNKRGCFCFCRWSNTDKKAKGSQIKSAVQAPTASNGHNAAASPPQPSVAKPVIVNISAGSAPKAADEATTTNRSPTSSATTELAAAPVPPRTNSSQPQRATTALAAAEPAGNADTPAPKSMPVAVPSSQQPSADDLMDLQDGLPAVSYGLGLAHPISSPVSTSYYSAGGWSQLGENGEWLGSSLERSASAECALAPDAHTSPAPAAQDAGAMGVGGEASVRAEAARQGSLGHDHAHNHNHHGHHGHSHHHLQNHHHHHHTLAMPLAKEGEPLPVLDERSPQPSLHAAMANGDLHTAGAGSETGPSLQTQDAKQPAQKGSPGSGNTGAAAAATTTAAVAAAGPPAAPAAAAAAATSGQSAVGREAMLDRVADLYALQGQPCKACQVLLNYCKAQGVKPDTLQPELHARKVPDAMGLTKVAQNISESLADMASEEGWQVVRDDELRLLYKHLPGPGVHAFRARCIMDAPAEQLMAITREVDLCPTWNKYCTSAAALKENSLTDVLVYMSLWVPWPFNAVGFLVEASGADLLEEEGWLHVALGGPSKEALSDVQLPPGSEKHRRVRILPPSCVSFKPLPPAAPGGPARTLVRIQSYVDPGTRAVPPFVISFVLKVLSPFVYSAAQKVLASAFKSPDNPMPARMKQRPELYDMVRRRSEAYLASHKDAASLGREAEVAMAASTKKKAGSRRAKG